MARTPRGLITNEKVKRVAAHLPPLNFITIHYTYFIVTCLIASLIFWGSSNPSKSITYTDSLFLVVSAMTEAGLNTVNLSQMTTFQQIILWILIVIGSSVFVSISTVLTRKRVFESRFKHVVKMQKERKRSRSGGRSAGSDVAWAREITASERLDVQRKAAEPIDRSGFESRHSGPRDPTLGIDNGLVAAKLPDKTRGREVASDDSSTPLTAKSKNEISAPHDEGHGLPSREMSEDPDHITFVQYASQHPSDRRARHRVLSFEGVGAHPNSSSFRLPHSEGITNRTTTKLDENAILDEPEVDSSRFPHYLNRHTTGRNGQFFGLSRAEREHLGGVEYRAITMLAYVVPVYFTLWQLLGCLSLAAYFAHNKADVARENGINPWWLGIFNGVSAFNNSGMSLLDANMIPFQTAPYPLITMGLMILAGNTAYPLFLRLIFSSMLKFFTLIYPSEDRYSEQKATIRFILQYPRRVYTNLFPSAQTWWLLFMVIVLNGVDWAAFELLNIGNPATNAIPKHYRVLDGLFQALAVRSGGFYIIAIPTLRIGLQVLYVIMMYISVYPVVITMRHSNVYEERSLGIYADDDAASTTSDDELPKSTVYKKVIRTVTNTLAPFVGPTASGPTATATGARFIRHQIHGQLAHDIWLLVLAILFITCIEVSNFDRDPVTYSVFNIMFEVISGYGCVGISTGLPNEAYSFSGGWHVCSKLILCVVMLRGRHRGLPVALDRAVRLPEERERVGWREEEDRVLRKSISMRRASVV